jgi:hypothetical protein
LRLLPHEGDAVKRRVAVRLRREEGAEIGHEADERSGWAASTLRYTLTASGTCVQFLIGLGKALTIRSTYFPGRAAPNEPLVPPDRNAVAAVPVVDDGDRAHAFQQAGVVHYGQNVRLAAVGEWAITDK